MRRSFSIAGRPIGPGHPVYVIAELSANHRGSFDEAAALVEQAADAGADAVKLQTYTADTLTLDAPGPWFQIEGDNPWQGRTLYGLYQEGAMPWDWQPRLAALAIRRGIACFSTPFDSTAVAFLAEAGMPAFKIASFELIDHGLLAEVARQGLPVILSTGMAEAAEIDEAVALLERHGCTDLALLKCTSAYPAPVEEMNLHGLSSLAARFQVPVGLSDHTLDTTAVIAAVALGATVVEKHLTLSRAAGGPDASFSLEPAEFRATVDAIRTTERALGDGQLTCGPSESASRVFRRSLFVVADVPAGARFTSANVRSIRPGHGLPPRHLAEILGRTARRDVLRGTPLSWDLVAPERA